MPGVTGFWWPNTITVLTSFICLVTELWWQNIGLIFICFNYNLPCLPLSCSFLILVLFHGMVRSVTLIGETYPLSSALLSRGSIPLRTAFLDGYDQTPPLYLPTQILRKVFTRPRTIHLLRLGPWPNIYIDLPSLVFHPLIIASRDSSLLLTFQHTRRTFINILTIYKVMQIRRLRIFLEIERDLSRL